MLKVNEIFGPTVQGEGSAAGRHCVFLRLALCNLECKWCDTPYTWSYTTTKAQKHESGVVYDRHTNIMHMSEEQVFDGLMACWDIKNKPTIVVVSGGEPLLQADALSSVTWTLQGYGNQVHIETAGTLKPTEALDLTVTQYNVSPKLANSGNRQEKRYVPPALDFFAADDRSWFKFVVKHVDDFEEIDFIAAQHHIPRNRIMVMPEGTTPDAITNTAQSFVEAAIYRGWGLSLRSHILLWPDIPRGK